MELAVARRQAWNARTGRHPDALTTAFQVASLPALDEGDSPVAEESNDHLIREALAARGERYRWGGASRGGFDCSGFTRYLFARHAGVTLPHSASAQARLGQKVTREALKPGDLLFFSTYRRGISHVGIYIGGNRFVHAANTRRRVRVDTLTGYYMKRFITARRLIPTGKPVSGGFGPSPAEEPPVEIPVDATDQKPELPLDATPALDGGAAPTEQGEPSLPTRVDPDS